MKHHNQLRSGSLLTYVQMTLNIIVSIAYTPFMLRILGKSEYGLYSTVASTIAILSVLSLGFGGSYVRYSSSTARKRRTTRSRGSTACS